LHTFIFGTLFCAHKKVKKIDFFLDKLDKKELILSMNNGTIIAI